MYIVESTDFINSKALGCSVQAYIKSSTKVLCIYIICRFHSVCIVVQTIFTIVYNEMEEHVSRLGER